MANNKQPSRRAFLKASGITAFSSALIEEGLLDERLRAEQTPTRETAPQRRNFTDWVNLLQGTASTREFSRGNTLPIAAMPFGMAHWTLQSHDDTPWMFQPEVRRIQGVRCTHQLSPWLSDYGQATFLPFRGEIDPGSVSCASSYAVEQARLAPHALELFLLRYRAQVVLSLPRAAR